MKNYIEKKGIKKEEILYITPKGSTIKILSFYNGIAECEIINPFPGGSPAGSKGKVKIQDMPNLQKLIDENKQKEEIQFLEKYPGIDELLNIINLHCEANEAFEEMMDSGDGVLRKSTPKISIEEARKIYPEAATYMDILKLSDADPSSQIGFIRRQAGKIAINLLLSGESASSAIIKAKEYISNETNSPKYKEHVAGL